MLPALLLGLGIAFGLTVPLLCRGAPFLLVLASESVIAGLVALSLDLLTGNTGLLSFGHATWYGFGAYCAGLASSRTSNLVILLVLTVATATIASAAIGAVLVRQIGKTFAILTLAFGQILFALVFVLSTWTGGEDGLQGVPTATVFGHAIVRPETWYWVLYAFLVSALLASLALRRSPLGRAWLAIRENAERARFIGLRVNRLKLVAYVLSASLAALAGALYVLFNGAASPDLLGWLASGQVLMYVVLGGVGTLVGPVIGAAVFTFAEHYISSYTQSWLIYFGGLFVLIVIVAPGGLFGLAASLWARLGVGRAEGRP